MNRLPRARNSSCVISFNSTSLYVFSEYIRPSNTYCKGNRYIPDMSSKRKSQPTRIRDQIEDSELHASPIHSPNTQLEKGMFTPLNEPYFLISISKFIFLNFK